MLNPYHIRALIVAATVVLALFAGAERAEAWVSKNLRDQPGRSNVNLHVAGGRLAFEVERHGSHRLTDGSDLAAISAAMRTLSSVSGTSVDITNAGPCDLGGQIHSRDGLKQNGKNQIYFFQAHDPAFPAVAVTAFFYDTATGQIAEADIALNEADYTFSTATPDDPNQYLGSLTVDLQEVVTHELMHALGFEHSPVAGRFDVDTGCEVAGYRSQDFGLHATLFPIATQTIQGRTLSEDDTAGLRAVYGSGTATLTGRVVDGATGRGVKGAHVVAVRPDAPDVPVVGTITGTGSASGPGEFVLAGLPEGDYYLRIEPLCGGSNPFQCAYTSYTGFDTSFEPEFYSGGAESCYDEAIGMDDAEMINTSAASRSGAIVFVTNAEPAPMAISSAVFKSGKLKITGSGFPAASVAVEVDGERLDALKIPKSSLLTNGTATRIVSKDSRLASMLSPTRACQAVVVNLTTGERSPAVTITMR